MPSKCHNAIWEFLGTNVGHLEDEVQHIHAMGMDQAMISIGPAKFSMKLMWLMEVAHMHASSGKSPTATSYPRQDLSVKDKSLSHGAHHGPPVLSRIDGKGN